METYGSSLKKDGDNRAFSAGGRSEEGRRRRRYEVMKMAMIRTVRRRRKRW